MFRQHTPGASGEASHWFCDSATGTVTEETVTGGGLKIPLLTFKSRLPEVSNQTLGAIIPLPRITHFS